MCVSEHGLTMCIWMEICLHFLQTGTRYAGSELLEVVILKMAVLFKIFSGFMFYLMIGNFLHLFKVTHKAQSFLLLKQFLCRLSRHLYLITSCELLIGGLKVTSPGSWCSQGEEVLWGHQARAARPRWCWQ